MANDDFEAARFLSAVGENVLNHRESAGLTQADLARRCELSVVAIDQIERGRSDVRLLTMERIAIAVSADICELLDVSGSEVGIRPSRR